MYCMPYVVTDRPSLFRSLGATARQPGSLIESIVEEQKHRPVLKSGSMHWHSSSYLYFYVVVYYFDTTTFFGSKL
jgi:hypothetical protein